MSGQSYDICRNFVKESSIQTDASIASPRSHVFVSKKRISPDFNVNQGDSLVLDVVYDTAEDSRVGQTLKRAAIPNWSVEGTKHVRREDTNYDTGHVGDNGRSGVSTVKDIQFSRSRLMLEVIAGPARGVCCSRLSTETSILPLTLGRVAPSDLVLRDSEVSGKHAIINWNMNIAKWELVDMGSLNGTYLNSYAIYHPDSGSRQWSEPVVLANGDIITLGTSSKVSVQISEEYEHRIPFGVGVASDPMAMRRGGKRLPMEDMCYCQWPLPGVEQFGLFGIFDGHGGAEAAKTASKMLPHRIADILSNPEEKASVLSRCDASDVLREAFSLTEAAMNHQYEGCTATVLLVWIDHNRECFAQCANVGDSACVVSIGGKQITMTEDHRVTSLSERSRCTRMGMPLKDGESRLCGINLVRMLGDKFLKEQDGRFSSEPYISQPVHMSSTNMAFALLASDGLWDVMSIKKAVQLVVQTKERYAIVHDEDSAEKVANYVLGEARALRTKDNTSVIFLDFDNFRTDTCI